MSVCVDLSGLSVVEIVDVCGFLSDGDYDFFNSLSLDSGDYIFDSESFTVHELESMLDDDKLMSVSEYLELPTVRYVGEGMTGNNLRIFDSSGIYVDALIGSVDGAVSVDNLHFKEKSHAIQTLREIADWLEGKL